VAVTLVKAHPTLSAGNECPDIHAITHARCGSFIFVVAALISAFKKRFAFF
jgi:hypothetical protein